MRPYQKELRGQSQPGQQMVAGGPPTPQPLHPQGVQGAPPPGYPASQQQPGKPAAVQRMPGQMFPPRQGMPPGSRHPTAAQFQPQRPASVPQGFGPQVPPPAYSTGIHRPKASGAKMLGPRGALMGGHPARPLLGPAPHLTGSGGSVTALSGSETDVSTSTENLTQVGNIEY